MIYSVRLEAHNPARNCHRFYALDVFEGLPGYVVVETRYGRVGTRGRVCRRATESLAQAREMVMTSLGKRRGATRRLGVAYAVVRLHDPQQWGVLPALPPSPPPSCPTCQS
ncbi:MAG: WGR domain-containing protein [Desulfovibrio sp.]|nr:WGR domain-containing protein [Desulfovibrio sp.]MCA1985424.1 WGR domain-containing protein [Desulfovibrio sp.]